MGLKQIDHGSKDYEKVIQLRHNIMRAPLGLEFSSTELENEKDYIHIGSFEDDELLGCCMLVPIKNKGLQLRQMAVKNNQQLKGVGASILTFAENLARDKGYKKIMMHARDTAVGFYEKFGYQVTGEPFLEINLPHHIMEKNL